MTDLWTVTETAFDPKRQHHKETVFTIGNGYLSTRGAFEEGYPRDRRATFIHGVFDAVPIVVTELVNAPDWLPLAVFLDDERFSLDTGVVESFERRLDLRNGVLARTVRWRSPGGRGATLVFERFVSLADEHLAYVRCTVTPDFAGVVEFRAALHGAMDNEGVAHWQRVGQGAHPAPSGPLPIAALHCQTRTSGIGWAGAMHLVAGGGRRLASEWWDADNAPTLTLKMKAVPGKPVGAEKRVAQWTTRDLPEAELVATAVTRVAEAPAWKDAFKANAAAWAIEWARTDVVIEGDDEAQIAMRFNLFQMLIAAPRHDDRVNIGAKTLSGFGYRGHAFWDTEIFMLPLFTYTAPEIARNLLNYRYNNLPAAREKARGNGVEGAQFPWESADTGEEVTPTWVPHFADRNKLVRIWTGDIEIHISADIAYAAHQYWRATGDDAWYIAKGVELILDTAKFWASRAEWNAADERYEYRDVIGPDEYHEHVDNNAYTNRFAQWNLETALETLAWLRARAPERAAQLTVQLDLTADRLAHWRDVIDRMHLHVSETGLIEQFDGYFARQDVDLAALEPRTRSAQEIFGIEGCNETQVLKQPDVLMLQYLLQDHYTEDQIRTNYGYYNPRTDHTYGSSLGPSIQAIVACMMGYPDDAYEHFIRAVRADLRDVRGNAGDGIHGASAAGTWQAVAFGFGGLRITPEGWTVTPRLPKGWTRLAFSFMHRGMPQQVDLRPEGA
ncbi:MAG TPA: glycoside hydrolase family 65 protein [Anaerolineales bacterium]|nr:glycoside hydrolase family 65 protein [Anaerolineales bacterium]